MKPLALVCCILMACGVAAAAASASAPREAAPAYVLGPEDEIEVFVWKQPDLSTTVTIRPDGRISLPLVGELTAAGKEPQALRQEVVTRLKQYVAEPVVTVVVKTVNSPQISVLGEVRRPGRYRILQRATVLDAIAMGGGLTEFARRGEVVVLRSAGNGSSAQRRMHVNLKEMLRDGAAPLVLEPGDTVYVQ